MTTPELLAIVGAILGGGGLWTYLLSRRKSQAEASEIATRSALEAQGQVLESLKARITELEADKRAREDDTASQLAVMREKMERSESQRQYFAKQLEETQAEVRHLQQDNIALHGALAQEREARQAVEVRLAGYLRRFPQFDDTFSNPRKGTAPLKEPAP